MLATASVFDSLEQDDTMRRVASRRALALAHQRVEANLGRFLRAAQNAEEFMERLALVQDDFAGYVSTASQEVGHGHPEHIAAALKDHYRIAAQKPVRRWAPRLAEDKQSAPLGDQTKQAAPYPGWENDVPAPVGTGREVQLGAPVAPSYPGYPQQDGPHFPASEPIPSIGQGYVPGQDDQFGEFGDQLGTAMGMGQPQPHPMSPQYRQQARQPGPWVESSAQDTTMQDDDSARLVTCPECGGSCKTANGSQCPRCNGKGKVTNFGSSVLDAVSAVTSGEGNTDLDGPEPKMDKRQWTPSSPGKPDVPGRIKEKDVIKPIPARNDSELEEIDSRTEKQDLPTATNFDDSGFNTETPGGKGDKTKTFGDGKAADPVTRETISSTGNPLADLLREEWPTDQSVGQAFNRFNT